MRPPATPLADVGVLMPLVDRVLLVVRAGITSKPAIHEAVAAIDQAKCLGLVLNEADVGAESDVMQVFNRHVSGRSLTVFAFEVVLISGSIALAGEMYGISGSRAFLWRLVIVTALCQLTFYYNDLYDLTIVQSRRELIVRLLQAAGSAAILIAVARVAVPSVTLDARTFVTALSVFVVAVLTWRLAFNSLSRAPHLEERILILGTGPAARMLARQIGMRQDFGYRLIGFVDDRGERSLVRRHDILGDVHDVGRLVAERQVTRIVVGSRRPPRQPSD